MKEYFPFVRWTSEKSHKKQKEITWKSYVPELLYLSSLILSFIYWPYGTSDSVEQLIFGIWALILLFLFALLIKNLESKLLPTMLVMRVFMLVVLFQIVRAVSANSLDILVSSLLGAFLLGGILWIIYQVSNGKWIGGGDVRLGFVAGFLLGWQVGLICIALAVLSFIFVYIILPMMESKNSGRIIPSGIIWVTLFIVCTLFGEKMLQAIT